MCVVIPSLLERVGGEGRGVHIGVRSPKQGTFYYARIILLQDYRRIQNKKYVTNFTPPVCTRAELYMEAQHFEFRSQTNFLRSGATAVLTRTFEKYATAVYTSRVELRHHFFYVLH